MREFNLEEAKAGKPVCTRDGREVIEVTTIGNSVIGYRVLGRVLQNRESFFTTWTSKGKYFSYVQQESKLDLFMVDECSDDKGHGKKSVYVPKRVRDREDEKMDVLVTIEVIEGYLEEMKQRLERL